ncbi:MAG TPA: LCCL domain-containing protein, partial [Candidatus Limnocylindrales bacterium]|nr:LCCL domain-containing protein [Candidatus Limnocylindrales bacterium]
LDLAEGEAMDVTCPAGCDTGRLWGTDIYTADSTVCWAAQHAGVIRIGGGSFTVTALGPQQEFAGSTQNGVTSASWASYDASFEVAALAPEATPEVTPEATASCDTEVVCDAPAELGGGLGLPGAPFIYINPDDSSIFTAALPQGWTALTEEGKAPVLTTSPEAGAGFDAGEIPPDSMVVQVQLPSSLVANLNIDPSLRGDAVIDAVIAALGPGFGEPFKLPDLPIVHRMVQVADASVLPVGVQGAVLVAQIDGDVLAFVILYSVDDTAMTAELVPLVMSATYLPGEAH